VIVFWDESGASLLPVTRRTIGHHFKWKRCSMAAALCYGSLVAARRSPSTIRSAPTTPRP